MDDISLLCGFPCGQGFKAVCPGPLIIFRSFRFRNDDTIAAVPQVQGLRVPLIPVADHGNAPVLQEAGPGIAFVIHFK